MKKAIIMIISVFLGFTRCADLPPGDILDGVKPGRNGAIDIITIFSHPDDEVFYVGGTLLKAKKDPRVRLHVLCLTNGNLDEAKENLNITPKQLACFRLKELEMASAVLGADSVSCLDYDDQGLVKGDQGRLLWQVSAAVAKTDAEIIVTHDPFGISGHPDHITCSKVALLAYKRSRAQRLYYVTMSPARYRFNLIFALSDDRAEKSRPSLRVDISAEKKMKKLALYSHVTQHHFSFWNGIAMCEDLLFDSEYFAKVSGL